MAESIRRSAVEWRDAFAAADDPEGMTERLLRWDAELKMRGVNPGTSADLTVAALFAASLSSIRGPECAPTVLPSRPNDD